MIRLPIRLVFLNSLRWLREHLVSWGLLGILYSLTVVVVLQSYFQLLLKLELPFSTAFICVYLLLLLPIFIVKTPWPSLGIFGRLSGVLPRGLGKMYSAHELRRGAYWASLGVVVLLGAFWVPQNPLAWILICMIPIQGSLYSIGKWRVLGVVFENAQGPASLIRGIRTTHLFGYLLVSLGMGVVLLPSESAQIDHLWDIFCAGFLSVLTAASLALEGDSGRPWLVNMFSLSAGLMAAMIWLVAPWWLSFLIVVYFLKAGAQVFNRFRSVEEFHEDAVIS